MPAPPSARKLQAAERAEQIRLGLQQTAVLYAAAVEEQDWAVLGYRNLGAWRTGEFGPDRFSPERRKEICAILTEHGWTQRAIANATGASTGTIANDQRNTPRPPRQSPRQDAARDRETRNRETREAIQNELDRRHRPPAGQRPLDTQPRDTDIARILSNVDAALDGNPPPAQDPVTLHYQLDITIQPRNGYQIPAPHQITADLKDILTREMPRRYNTDCYEITATITITEDAP